MKLSDRWKNLQFEFTIKHCKKTTLSYFGNIRKNICDFLEVQEWEDKEENSS